MVHTTHVSFAISVALAPITTLSYFANININEQVLGLFIFGISIGAIFPDIDEPNSKIGKKCIGISEIIKTLFGHRGATHYFVVPIFMTLLLILSNTKNIMVLSISFGFITGYFLHIIGDSMTKSGINKAFWPLSNKSFGLFPKKYRFYTNSSVERFIVLPLSTSIMLFELYVIFRDIFVHLQ
ncbi:metal-dependent hydrolase [Campylobacter hyointestinalis]|uniref:metal-dependent hydrolase n=1 Tax=Campylobacter hyointestinalis TaxID=198 RepID=UPI000CE31B47|nr:metal-dependent hydrolase [Campylobacter hyointestinalis]PPB72709.1 hypothetical protein CDQ79_06040 [Campylobacter hyointestinalis subsp. hyointestinalis]PPB74840.1 hypothetical protein CDQ80_05620 [Campylobacter hyointestinalis subsp. hyointestinalis]PPB76752.1 hypothetical protein CDQ81_05535 [Campylobacter hyointestinalis subsp. hyointestinalis]PPB76894.1 hypothetical protein CDQ82_07260 [Campylobacter hyointestinalis subsp. hyointestinalis]